MLHMEWKANKLQLYMCIYIHSYFTYSDDIIYSLKTYHMNCFVGENSAVVTLCLLQLEQLPCEENTSK